MTGPLMARPNDPARVLRSRLEAVADPVRAAGEAKYLKLERRRVIGASMPGAERALTGVVQEFGLPTDLDMLDALFGASLEEAWCAIWMLAAQPAFNVETWRLTEAWSEAPDTWALADPISLLLVAGHLEAGVIAEDVLIAWAARESPFWYGASLWWRRCRSTTGSTDPPGGGCNGSGACRRSASRRGRNSRSTCWRPAFTTAGTSFAWASAGGCDRCPRSTPTAWRPSSRAIAPSSRRRC